LRNRILVTAGIVSALFLGSPLTGRAEEFQQGLSGATATTVGPVTATITALNYDESGAAVNGLLVGTNVLLTFARPVCGGIGTLGAVGNSVTYSGMALTLASGFQVVHVTSFTNGSITYPPPAPPKPAAYPATAGTIGQLNYGETGSVNGFVFTPTSGPKVFVDIGKPSTTLAPLLTVGASVSVTGTLEAPPQCAQTGALSEVDATSLTIGTTTYPIRSGGVAFPFFSHR
jgi:hypothetical protein